ncbi:ABC transporter substrate-binding protein [Parasphingopyxis marina]|uniref:ABC transporter substrate-binding protein n=1 Tax=Parasphingopyxis marina TaxID=2761622 RepID=A0A842HTL9_9SPHN|nr:ABC transporter substrate-binding protein [Parasphingopyxis marina]MBC2777268.1 ABC transporter substrate-binding protein [Parasphingopyxis marina]
MFRRFLPALALALAACSGGDDGAPVRVDMIGEAREFRTQITASPSREAALLLAATAQGLVRRDAEGQIDPGLAQRWTVLDDGRTYVFRLNDVTWNDGTALTAGQVARVLRNASRPGSRNPLAPLLADIEDINAVTPQILEIVLERPRIDFLQLLAAPELAILIDGSGLGPFEIAEGYEPDSEMILLSPHREPPEEVDGEAAAPLPIAPNETVELRFLPAAMAVARFDAGMTGLVTGGDWTTLLIAEAIDPPTAQLRIDAAEGLFGLAVVEQRGFVSSPQGREILSLAIDRAALADHFGRQEAEPRFTIVPEAAEGIAYSIAPPWQDNALPMRREFARQAVAQWRAANGEIPPIRIALPDAPGSRVIFAVLRMSWAAIGVPVTRVGWTEDADLRLVDRIAATESATWYLEQFRCGQRLPCSDAFRRAMQAIEDAPSERARSIRITEAALELQSAAPFIPLTRPIRWSLVTPRLSGFTVNSFASHPLDALLPPTG